MTREEALQKCTESMQSDNEVFNNNLTDNYLDWCVFDLMTTGSTTYDFVAAAHVAQNDAIKLDRSRIDFEINQCCIFNTIPPPKNDYSFSLEVERDAFTTEMSTILSNNDGLRSTCDNIYHVFTRKQEY